MSKVDFILLHGFLGLPRDWENVIENINADLEGSGIEGVYHKIDYFNRPNLGPKNKLETVAPEFINYISSIASHPRKVLVGYSLGGRMALHIFEKNPEMFEHLVLVSTHPGLKPFQEPEIKERESRDLFWSELFLNHNCEEVVQKWNEQSVFEGSEFEPERDASHYRRDLLSKALVNWSLSKQADKRMILKRHSKKISFVIGERDKKFIELGRTFMSEIPDIHLEMISLAGHRVLFDNALELAKVISASVLTPAKKN